MLVPFSPVYIFLENFFSYLSLFYLSGVLTEQSLSQELRYLISSKHRISKLGQPQDWVKIDTPEVVIMTRFH